MTEIKFDKLSYLLQKEKRKLHETYRYHTLDCIRIIGGSKPVNQRGIEWFGSLRRHRNVKIRFVTLQESIQRKLTHC